ncbi:hypothetical protein [Usitatibacter palustris]|uniref:Uncharacterized protein n=1 Tax=Usitatibacter palustris TaxID=2732487 RepID=A0A6M4H2U8_9PROT|nr:hypothetical protein [Usitatibacter palustris]QJR13398.1 hypothetical protein DSM104440_00181 [Usitatibacter palustris]
MDADKTLKDPFIQIVDDHIASGDPPETQAAYDKLIAKERSPSQAKNLIARVIQKEMQEMMASGGSFDVARYKAGLDKLLASQE